MIGQSNAKEFLDSDNSLRDVVDDKMVSPLLWCTLNSTTCSSPLTLHFSNMQPCSLHAAGPISKFLSSVTNKPIQQSIQWQTSKLLLVLFAKTISKLHSPVTLFKLWTVPVTEQHSDHAPYHVYHHSFVSQILKLLKDILLLLSTILSVVLWMYLHK